MEDEDSKKIFNSELEKSDIISIINFNNFNQLNYIATIPKNKIFTDDDKANNNTFSIGIESGFMEISSTKSEQRQGKAGGKSGSAGGMSGGMKSGGMKSGGGRSGGNSRGQGQQYSALSEPIKIWFSVNLTNK